ncbi:MAG: ornithine cyclodeaminase [Alphaproteobacteria bacterium]
MQMIDAARVHEFLAYNGLIEAIRQAHLGGMPRMTDRLIYQQPHPDGQPDIFIILPAWQPQEGLLAKLVTSFPRNKQLQGISTVNSIYVFINGGTGVTEAIIDGEAMIFRKTSADSALGASLLARTDTKILLMIGAGRLAPYMVRAHCSVRPSIKNVLVWNRTSVNAARLVATLHAEGIHATAVNDLDDALGRADIISSATMAIEPLVKGKLLRPGVHVDLVGSFTPEMRESDDDVLLRADVFVDHRQTTERSGEFLGPFARGVITPADIKGDLFELCQARVTGRTSPEQITVMKNGGGSHIDYFVAKYLMDRLNGRPFDTSCAS